MDIASRHHVGDDVIVDELTSNFGSVRLTDIPEVNSSDLDNSCDAQKGCEDLERDGSAPTKKSLEKSATFPSSGKMTSSVASSNEEDAVGETRLQPLQSDQLARTVSLPLISAMKGSRVKEGAVPRKLVVTWAPDVYDPIPNSLSHAVAVGTKQKSSRKYKDKGNNNYKKNGKKGQKGNSSRGAGKDKKQFRRHGGRYAKSYKSLDASDEDDTDVANPEYRGGFLKKSADDGIDVGSPDYCGSSFLKRSASKFHYPVAEAL